MTEEAEFSSAGIILTLSGKVSLHLHNQTHYERPVLRFKKKMKPKLELDDSKMPIQSKQ